MPHRPPAPDRTPPPADAAFADRVARLGLARFDAERVLLFSVFRDPARGAGVAARAGVTVDGFADRGHKVLWASAVGHDLFPTLERLALRTRDALRRERLWTETEGRPPPGVWNAEVLADFLLPGCYVDAAVAADAVRLMTINARVRRLVELVAEVDEVSDPRAPFGAQGTAAPPSLTRRPVVVTIAPNGRAPVPRTRRAGR